MPRIVKYLGGFSLSLFEGERGGEARILKGLPHLRVLEFSFRELLGTGFCDILWYILQLVEAVLRNNAIGIINSSSFLLCSSIKVARVGSSRWMAYAAAAIAWDVGVVFSGSTRVARRDSVRDLRRSLGQIHFLLRLRLACCTLQNPYHNLKTKQCA